MPLPKCNEPQRSQHQSDPCWACSTNSSPIIAPSRIVRIRSHRFAAYLIVCHQQKRAVEFAVQHFQQIQNFFARRRIQISRRLVRQQQRRTKHQRPRNRHSLTLPTGQLIRPVRFPLPSIPLAPAFFPRVLPSRAGPIPAIATAMTHSQSPSASAIN